LLHAPQCVLEDCRLGWLAQAPHWLLALQDCVPPLQVPQAREPLRHSTQRPVLARHCGVAPEQAGWLVHAPELEQS
jgi:hypothetical protein